ncbi:MATE family efflux transporter [Streptomyces sp. TP-A0874]|uniref:MATE family efflux transporter n=1 Tax=Streptomyces sp. TP-A0874 TaxID=549819 RepID=UPI000852DB7E|nr:MATE family efflux transporter [Streptomyces sp. TP-A0874]
MSESRKAAALKSRFGEIAQSALPLYLTMIAASTGSLVDTALLGHHSTDSLAALTVTLAVFSPATATVSGALRGLIPFVSGKAAGGPEGILPAVRNGMWLAVVVGGLGGAAVASVPLVAALGGVPESTRSQLGALPILLALAVVASAWSSAAGAVLIGLGRGRLVMRAGLSGTAVAVGLSPVLVAGLGPAPRLGLTGAGVAMLASCLVSAVLAQSALRRRTVLAGHSLRLGRPNLPEALRLARVGIPLAGTVLVKFAVLGVLAFAAARIGTAEAAVQSICVSLSNLIFTAAVAVGQATVPPVAAAAEEGDVVAVRRSVLAGAAVALSAVAVLGTTAVLLRSEVFTVFTSDSEVRGRAVALLPLVLTVVVADALQAVSGFGLIGIKRTLPSLLSFTCCYGALALVAVPAGSAGGLPGLWTALACANLLLVAGQSIAFHVNSGRLGSAAPAASPA